MLNEFGKLNSEIGRWFVTREIDEVNGSGSGHDVNGGSENENSGTCDDANEIVFEVEPELVDFVWVHL